MALSSREVHGIFLESFGRKFTAGLVRCALRAQERAPSVVNAAGVLPRQAHDLLPHVRRALFETEASGIVAQGVRVEVRNNCARTSSFVEFTTDQAAITSLTRACTPRALPDVLYRNARAVSSQHTMFEIFTGELPATNDNRERIYGCFVYGGAGTKLQIARVYFPIPRQPLGTISALNLLADHADLIDEERAHAHRPVESEVKIALELKRRHRGAQES